MNVNELLAERTPREKFLLAVLLVASIAVGGYYLLDSPAPKQAPMTQVPAPVMAARAAVPVTTAANQPVERDPFLPPPEFANFDKPPQSASMPPAGAYPGADYPQGKAGAPTAAGQGGVPALKGVVNSNGNYMAIIGGRSYGVGEKIGGYVLESVSMKSATLSGPGGRLVLTLGK